MMKLVLLAASCPVLAQIGMLPDALGNAIPKEMKDGFINNAMNGPPKNNLPNAPPNFANQLPAQKPPQPIPQPTQSLDEDEDEESSKGVPASVQNLLVSQVESQRAAKQTDEGAQPTDGPGTKKSSSTSIFSKEK